MAGPDKGDGALQKLKAEIRKLKLDGRVSLPGAVPKQEVPNLMAQHDFFINTANIDNTPVSVIEAMACGLPVVSTNVGGIPYLVEHEKTALLVERGNAQAMAQAVERLLKEPDLASSSPERTPHGGGVRLERGASAMAPAVDCGDGRGAASAPRAKARTADLR